MDEAERDWGQFGLLLIDVQSDFWSPPMAESFTGFSDSVARLLGLCRSEGVDVVHLRALFRADMSDWMVRYRLRGRIPCVEGTEGAKTLPFAAERSDEFVLVKQTFDGFHKPELVQHLRANDKRFLLTAGLITSASVLLTTASAAQLGFLTAVAEDCCADEPFAHEHTLDRYQYMFERTKVDLIVEHHPLWVEALKELERTSVAA